MRIVENDVGGGLRKQLVRLASELGRAGSVLIVAKGKRECEKLAAEMLLLLGEKVSQTANPKISDSEPAMERLDSRLERELYPDVLMRKLLRSGIAYHHAGLPPRVRVSLEDAIRAGFISYVFATTTLAEGVNFPFASVVVQSLALREAPQRGRPASYHPVTPRAFWNLAGRAGRPGYDKEGQVILFEPSLGLEKTRYVLGDYLNATLSATEPVKSALVDAVSEVAKNVEDGTLSLKDLSNRVLPENTSKRVKGALNLIRVSLIHAKASGIDASPEEILSETFATRFFDSHLRRIAAQLFDEQETVVSEFLADPTSPSKEMAAELGLSIETLTDLKDWSVALEDWQIENVRKIFYGGSINSQQVRYFVSPVAARMAELEGPKLGGFLSEIILFWLSGAPFISMRTAAESASVFERIEDLVAVIYSRIQYLLPWGLFAADSLLEAEAKRRRIQYDNELMAVANLADAGVPSFDAMRLVHLEFERTDATRIANEYQRRGGLKTGIDILGWAASLSRLNLELIMRGRDKRRLDYDLDSVLQRLKLVAKGER